MISFFKKTLSPADYLMIAANLAPVAGVFFFGWSPVEVFIVYCLETIITGIITLVKMGIVTIYKKNDIWYSQGGKSVKPGLVFMLFFLVHYGMFTAIQMGLFFSVSGIAEKAGISFFNFIYTWPSLLSRDSLVLLCIFFFCYALKMVFDFIYTRRYREASLILLMFEPYGRIIIQQFTVILGSTFLSLGAGKLFILIFALVKIGFDIFIDYNRLLQKGINEIDKKSGEQ